MANSESIGEVILWSDGSNESIQAKEELARTGVEYTERIVTDPTALDVISPPTLQLFTYRVSGLALILAIAQDQHMGLKTMVDLDRQTALAYASLGDEMREQDPTFSLATWPTWSPRYNQ